MKLVNVQEFGNSLAILIDDGKRVLAHPFSTTYYKTVTNDYEIKGIYVLNDNMLSILMDSGDKVMAYPNNNNDYWTPISNEFNTTPDLIDTLLPGHSVTNPGGTIAAGWQWHLDNNSNRGGVDLNYNFQDFKAPGKGSVDHFDVSGVGMVVRLTLTTPAVRTKPQLTNDAFGPMTAIWFQHCSDSYDGSKNQNVAIGKSGDGYGAYGSHLHVHGVDSGGNRCNFWGFV